MYQPHGDDPYGPLLPNGPLRARARHADFLDENTQRRIAPSNKTVGFFTADRICCLLGVHMSEVYGDDYWNTPLNGA